MTASVRLVEGTVLSLCCESCGARFPHFSFSGEEDSDTAGLYSATSPRSNELILAEAESSEWTVLASGDLEAIKAIESRLSQQFVRDDLRIVRLLRTEQQQKSAAGLSFAEFRKTYKPPILVYSCISCPAGESRVQEELTVNSFRKSGGNILLSGRLVLAEEVRPADFTG